MLIAPLLRRIRNVIVLRNHEFGTERVLDTRGALHGRLLNWFHSEILAAVADESNAAVSCLAVQLLLPLD